MELLQTGHDVAVFDNFCNSQAESLARVERITGKDGDAVATVGNSGGNPDSGLYFELRHRGQPFDPLKWASNR